jgi:hypothetical protein
VTDNIRQMLWMTVRVWILGHPWVLDPMDAGSCSFLHPWVEPATDPHRTGFRFRFSPAGASESRKNLKPKITKRNQKKPEIQKNERNLKNPKPKKSKRNPKKPKIRRKNRYKLEKALKETHLQPDSHLNST